MGFCKFPYAVGIERLAHFLALNHGAVDVKAALAHLDRVAGQADNALDVFNVLRHRTEDGDITAVGLAAHDAVGDRQFEVEQREIAVAAA